MVTRRGAVGRGASGSNSSNVSNGRVCTGIGATGIGTTTKQAGDAAEARALSWLLAQGRGLTLVQRNYRLARGPHARGGEIDLILRDRDGTLVFVEVRARAEGSAHGGAAASVGPAKQQRLLRAARHYLLRFDVLPACRFDVLAIDGDRIEWLQAAFDAG